jgi:hypothetical protein
MNRPIRISLIVFNLFLAVTAIAGGIGLLAGVNVPPIEFLKKSPFNSYFVPGLALLVLVGGSASFAATMLIRSHRHAFLANITAAAAIIIFETVEVAVIGSPEGVARNLQILYFAIGFASGAIALASKRSRHKSSASGGADPLL